VNACLPELKSRLVFDNTVVFNNEVQVKEKAGMKK